MKYKIISWNVNGLRSLLRTKFLDKLINTYNPDILCLSETKLSYGEIPKINGFKYQYSNNSSIRSGYSGVMILSNKKPKSVSYGINTSKVLDEGRVMTIEFKNFYLVNVYTPNSGELLKRLYYRTKIWDKYFMKYIKSLNKKVIICGDLNVAHQEIDIYSPKTNLKTAGFTLQERNNFGKLLIKLKLADTFRELYPDIVKYTFWSSRGRNRVKNKGWRLDYFLVSNKLKNKIKKSVILDKIMGSDHCPIFLQINI